MMTMTIVVSMIFHVSYILIDDDFVDDDDDGDDDGNDDGDDTPPEPCREPGPRPTLASRGNPESSRCFFTSSKSPTNSPLISS